MSTCNIAPIFNLKNNHEEISSITVDYDDKLVILFKFYNPTGIKFGLFGLIYQTIKEVMDTSKLYVDVKTVDNDNCLVFYEE